MTPPRSDVRWRSWFAVAMLVLALAPIVATVVRAIVVGWVPIFDAGYFTVRSRDVLTADHPWLGAWSSASVTLDATVRNLGPLQLDLLAPFTKVDPYWGTAVGVGAVAPGRSSPCGGRPGGCSVPSVPAPRCWPRSPSRRRSARSR